MERDLQMWIEGYFLFCVLWSVGAIIDYKSRAAFDKWFRTEIGQPPEEKDPKEKKEKKARGAEDAKPHKFLVQVWAVHLCPLQCGVWNAVQFLSIAEAHRCTWTRSVFDGSFGSFLAPRTGLAIFLMSAQLGTIGLPCQPPFPTRDTE